MNNVYYRKNKEWKSKIIYLRSDIEISEQIKKKLIKEEVLTENQYIDIIEISVMNIHGGTISVLVNYAIIGE